MKLNLEKFKELVRKSTINFAIDNVQFIVDENKIKSSMRSSNSSLVSIINIENDIFIDCKDELTLNFLDPNTQLMKYLNLYDKEEINIKINEARMQLIDGKQKSNINFCTYNTEKLTVLNSSEVKVNNFFLTLKIDEEFKEYYSKMKKISNTFGKIHFGIDKNKVFFMGTFDIKNKYSNGLSFDLIELEGKEFIYSFDSRYLNNIMYIIGQSDDFILNFYYNEEREGGMLYFHNSDKSEQYCIMDIKDI